MNLGERGRLRWELGLEHAPKVDLERRRTLAMERLFADGRSEEEVREIVSTSSSSWRRAKRAYDEARAMAEVTAPGPTLTERVLMEADPVRPVSPWRRKAVRAELIGVRGADLGDPWSDAWYLRFRAARQARRDSARREEREAAAHG